MPGGGVHYEDAVVGVRGDLIAAHGRFWDRLSRAGAWFTAGQRVAIAREVRTAYDCGLCRERKKVLVAASVDGSHSTSGALEAAGVELPALVVEVVHRIATDGARLSESWYQDVLDQGLSAERYIEILGTLVALISIDRFAEAIGVPLRDLPVAEEGEPSGYRPANVQVEPRDGWVPMIRGDANDPPEDDLWVRGQIGNVIRAMSLVPDEVRTLNDLGAAHYMENRMVGDVTQAPDRALDRAQIELIAARVSALNECFF